MGRYSWSRQYIATETEIDTTTVIFVPDAHRIVRPVGKNAGHARWAHIEMAPAGAPRVFAIQADVVQDDRRESRAARHTRK